MSETDKTTRFQQAIANALATVRPSSPDVQPSNTDKQTEMPPELLRHSKTRSGRLSEAITMGICEALAPILGDLKRRVAELEQTQVKYAGVWKPDTAYGKGTLVTDHGTLFYCKSPTCDRPGQSDVWESVAKRGLRR